MGEQTWEKVLAVTTLMVLQMPGSFFLYSLETRLDSMDRTHSGSHFLQHPVNSFLTYRLYDFPGVRSVKKTGPYATSYTVCV